MGCLLLFWALYKKWKAMKGKIDSLESDIKRLNGYVNVLGDMAKYNDPGVRMQTKLKDAGITKIAVYGIGSMGKLAVERLKDSDIQIMYYIDAGGSKKTFRGKTVYSLENVSEAEAVDAIVVTPVHLYNSISSDLYLEGRDEKILSLTDLIK